MVAAAPPGVKGVGFDHGTDDARRIREIAVALPTNGCVSGVGVGEIEHHLHGRGLPRAVGSEEPGHSSRFDGETQVVDDRGAAIAFGEVLHHQRVVVRVGHDGCSLSCGGPMAARLVVNA